MKGAMVSQTGCVRLRARVRQISAAALVAGVTWFVYLWLFSTENTPSIKSIEMNSTLPGWRDFLQQGSGSNRFQAKSTSDLNSSVCQVPSLHLDHDANKKYYPQLGPQVCVGSRLFYMENSKLRINRTYLGDKILDHCIYRAINRVSDMAYSYSKPVTRSANFEVTIDNDFFLVECYLKRTSDGKIATREIARGNSHEMGSPSKDSIIFSTHDDCKHGTSVHHWLWMSETVSAYPAPDPAPDYQHLIAQVDVRQDVLKRISAIKPPPRSTQMNVLILGMDSMSHMAYQRVMPLTYKYLKETLGAVVLNSYNVVGDGTLAAFIPLLTGLTELELPDTRLGSLFNKYADVYPLIWKKFRESGYVTLYGEDYPLIETFQMRMQGFKECPVDHYMRAFWQAAFEADVNLRKSGPSECLGGRGRHMFMLDYARDFFDKYRSVPKFAFQFLVEYSHSSPNKMRYADVDVRDLLVDLHSRGHLDNTLLVTMSDHGPRMGDMRNTAQGKIEERLPMMSLAFPKQFKNKYPDLVRNLQVNADRLTTAFDIHETLQSVLDISEARAAPDVRARGINLLQQVPANRTCADAGVDVHWCTCMEFETLDVNDTGAQSLSEFLVSHINMRTDHIRAMCTPLQLKNTLDVRLIHANKQMLKFTRNDGVHLRDAQFSQDVKTDMVHYQITIETSPNGGLYEATLRGYVIDGSLEVIGEVSRINKYGDQPKCIVEKYPNLRKYCLCKS